MFRTNARRSAYRHRIYRSSLHRWRTGISVGGRGPQRQCQRPQDIQSRHRTLCTQTYTSWKEARRPGTIKGNLFIPWIQIHSLCGTTWWQIHQEEWHLHADIPSQVTINAICCFSDGVMAPCFYPSCILQCVLFPQMP